MGKRIAYLGNFSVPYSTESHVAASLESLDHAVLRIQEGEVAPETVAENTIEFQADMFLWTQTYGLAESGGTRDDRNEMLHSLFLADIPTVGYHLDRWWGLNREDQILVEPFFNVDFLFTADGGHEQEWTDAGVNHIWLPPGVYHAEAYDGTPRSQYTCDVAFVGSWRQYGHEEWWPTRKAMLSALRARYGRRFKRFPVRQAVRGTDLTDLYASCKIAIGDSCLVGNPSNYWSDRIPETTGRGALLVHPYVEGLSEVHRFLPTFEPGNWKQMFEVIDYYLLNNETREEYRKVNATDTRNNHTYRNRMQEVIRVVLGDDGRDHDQRQVETASS